MKKYQFKINGNNYDVQIVSFEDGKATIEVNGTSYEVEVDKNIQTIKTPKLVRSNYPASADAVAGPTRTSPPTEPKGAGIIKSPLPGLILKVLVNKGDTVKIGQKLIILEAMKMENSIEATKDGKITSLMVKEGDSVMEGDILLMIGD
ncbi:MAG TPA: biotin/lipoyl-binding protein [Bacteroidales bacterium]|nr:biotin/lipoyl-binding protein [Bacteroidales bacterium]